MRLVNSLFYLGLCGSIYGAKPIAVLHGIASNAKMMAPFSEWLEATFDRPVFNLEIGNGRDDSTTVPLRQQLETLCGTIAAIPELADGFDFIGMSQGGLLARGYVEQCNTPRVENLITMVSPHGGEYFHQILVDMYGTYAQDHYSFAGFWRDPHDLEDYYKSCRYLPWLNNEITTPDSYRHKTNIQSLQNFVMIWSPEDDTLQPPQSGKFSWFNQQEEVVPIENTQIYRDDTLGLRFLHERDQLHIAQTNCSHVEHRDPQCYDQIYAIIAPILVPAYFLSV